MLLFLGPIYLSICLFIYFISITITIIIYSIYSFINFFTGLIIYPFSLTFYQPNFFFAFLCLVIRVDLWGLGVGGWG